MAAVAEAAEHLFSEECDLQAEHVTAYLFLVQMLPDLTGDVLLRITLHYYSLFFKIDKKYKILI
jgi:hypothetical protein